ncbi:hypothetical protein KIPB_014653 [Kipferlia bialata]|uniref:Uncharacterized protein n=1 Tax=Kipferlia bialata TaxID=797122 RepID=A0A9K3D926_9EUKA|nr:hypothetical protein KIPB_014653 [Kipferlia bialata]|eukprot:g14653.t1
MTDYTHFLGHRYRVDLHPGSEVQGLPALDVSMPGCSIEGTISVFTESLLHLTEAVFTRGGDPALRYSR